MKTMLAATKSGGKIQANRCPKQWTCKAPGADPCDHYKGNVESGSGVFKVLCSWGTDEPCQAPVCSEPSGLPGMIQGTFGDPVTKGLVRCVPQDTGCTRVIRHNGWTAKSCVECNEQYTPVSVKNQCCAWAVEK